MRRNRALTAKLSAAILIAASTVSGCGNHDEPATSAATSSDQEPIVSVAAPDPALTDAPAVAAAKASVVKIAGETPNCTLDGSGFVVAPNRVMTPAQVVAGGETFTVEADGKSFDARVVSFNPGRDLAILDVPNLPAAPLSFASDKASGGSDAILLGYSDAGGFVAIPARIREVINLNGPDIYKTTTVSREVYTIRGGRTEAAGGPLIDPDGKVLGVSFGASVDDPDTGFALTANEIEPQLPEVTNTAPVSTGRERC